ncbi:hypothetical protein [Candidatus Electronema sp. JM]|uniref:hypothetical protein n=1 Tax=Candidatus Electronema sp. JM TaxID=3401571 RepID=UPI003AA7B2F1
MDMAQALSLSSQYLDSKDQDAEVCNNSGHQPLTSHSAGNNDQGRHWAQALSLSWRRWDGVELAWSFLLKEQIR